MHIGNRSFPYPVLNRNEALSDYMPESTFVLEFDVDENGAPIVENGMVIFKNLRYTLTDVSLAALVEEGRLKGAFVVECSASVYRHKFDISAVPYDLHVPAYEINGNVVVSCYLYATEDIENFKSTRFVPTYAGYTFDIDKFDILAVDDGFKFKIDLDPAEDDKVASIFTIVKKEGAGDIISYDCNGKKIIIHLPSAFFDDYDNIKTKQECNNIAFSVLAIPALACSLDEVSLNDYESIEDIAEDYTWFNAVCVSYKRRVGTALTLEEFQNKNKFELAQLVLNSAPCNALKDFDNMLLGSMNPADGEGEEE